MKKLSYTQLADLVARVRTGDDDAFAALYAATVESQLYFATTFLKDAALAEDVVQEVYLSLYRSLHKLDNPKLFIAYLNRICYNTCVDYKKKMQKQKYELDEDSLTVQYDKIVDHNPDDRYAVLERNYEIYRALSSLSDQYRAAFLMRYYHNMRIREISIAMGCSESTVKRHIKVATTALKKKLGESRPVK